MQIIPFDYESKQLRVVQDDQGNPEWVAKDVYQILGIEDNRGIQMNIGICLFCNRLEKNYMPQNGNDFICSQCVQMLLAANQKDLKKAHTRAIDKGYLNKANAIESFLIPEGINEPRKPVTKKRGRHSNREGIVRAFRDKKKRIGRFEVQP
jgi:prophage antirepressor-like protein